MQTQLQDCLPDVGYWAKPGLLLKLEVPVADTGTTAFGLINAEILKRTVQNLT